ncbi:glycine dehydrogenase [Trichonephila clavipes]|nr:glycine dehydrogenase [Trichonephila clavipes]
MFSSLKEKEKRYTRARLVGSCRVFLPSTHLGARERASYTVKVVSCSVHRDTIIVLLEVIMFPLALQALLANISAMYAVYHGAEGLISIAKKVNNATRLLAAGVTGGGNQLQHDMFFDTIKVIPKSGVKMVKKRAEEKKINLRYFDDDTVSRFLF